MATKDYYWANRERVLEKQRNYYSKDPERWREYSREYKKKNRDKILKQRRQRSSTPSGIWERLGENGKKKVITKKEFIKWYENQRKTCKYCKVDEKKIRSIQFRCWKSERLQIDRKDNDRDYEKGNLVLACPICNFVKGYYFSFLEMLEIGKVLKEIRENRKTLIA